MKNPIKFFHVRKEGRNGKVGVATVASMVVPYVLETYVHFGVSFCSPSDHFDKRVGRALALEKMAKVETRYVTKFTGHSSDALLEVWNFIDKPEFWRKSVLHNLDGVGLTVIDNDRIDFVKGVLV